MSELFARLQELQRAHQEVADVQERMHNETSAIDSTVRDLLRGGWSGPASQSFAGAWHEWCLGAAEVTAALREIGIAIQQTQSDLQQQDMAGSRSFTSTTVPQSRVATRLAGHTGSRGDGL